MIGGTMGGDVTVKELIKELNLENFTPGIDTESIILKHPEINRPALQLAGFFDHFDNERVQIIGNVENAYIQTLDEERKKVTYDKLLSYHVPCVLYARGIKPDEDMLSYCIHYGVPCLGIEQSTTYITGELVRWLNVQLAPVISIHGVLVDVYGEGVLITGDSGIGKSEAALELVKRGHRLVSDDVVEIRRVSQQTLVGTAPDITKHFIELRGIGIIDVKALYGVLSVKDTQSIDLVIQLEDWVQNKDYDRLGLEDNYIEYLGNKVVCHVLPVRPGRNLAIIVETAAVNHRQKQMGYNAAKELYNRVQAHIAGKD